MAIVTRLMDYIELSLARRLDSISERMDENSRKLSSVISSYYQVEKRTAELKASISTSHGAGLLTDDVKFFFNMVKRGTLTPIKSSK